MKLQMINEVANDMKPNCFQAHHLQPPILRALACTVGWFASMNEHKEEACCTTQNREGYCE